MSLRKVSLFFIVVFIGIFITSCDGSTRIYGLEKSGKHSEFKKTKKYNAKHNTYYYGDYRNLPPGQHKKIHGDKSAKKYAPGQNKKFKKHKGRKH